MPTLFRFLMILGVIAGVITGSLYVLAEYFQPEPKEISKALRNVKGRIEETTASTTVLAPMLARHCSWRAYLPSPSRPQDVERSELPPLPGAAAPI